MTTRLASALWIVLISLSAWIYFPGLDGPALLDDGINLQQVAILDEHPDFLTDTVTGNYSGPLGRPITMWTFGLEKLLLDGGTFGNKSINLMLHLLLASLLAVFSRDVFRHLDYENPLALAIMTAGLWVLAPLLLSTVLYSIQRMAQLTALFTLLSMWSWLRFRLSSGAPAGGWILVCLGALAAAPLSKENGLLTLPMLILLEWQVLRFQGLGRLQTLVLTRMSAFVFGLGLAFFVLVLVLQPEFIVGVYKIRDYTLEERLLTQTRVLWLYLAQLLWVDSSQLGLYQDSYSISRSLTSPMTTLYACLAWLVTLVGVLALAFNRRAPLVVFGVSMFIVGHAMESSVFALEIYFEHRNYLPAMGVYIAVVGFGYELQQRWRWLSGWLLLVWGLIFGHGLVTTAVEAEIWSDEGLIHMTSLNRFPESRRANMEMARLYAQGGELEQAMKFSAIGHSLDIESGLRHQLMDIHFHCLARNDIDQLTIDQLTASADDFVDDEVSQQMYLLVRSLIADQCPQTDMAYLSEKFRELTRVSNAALVSPKMYVSLAIFENHLGRYAQALDYVDALLRRSPDNVRALMMKLYFTANLQLLEQHNEVRNRLRGMQAQGLLNQQQQYNLSLFLEDGQGVQ